MNWWEDQRTWSLNTLWRRWHFVMCENCFPMCFFEVGDLKVQLSWSLEGVNMEMTLFRRCEVLIIVLQDNHYPPQFFQQGKPQQKTNKKPNPSMEKFIDGARVVIPFIKGLSEQYRNTLAKHRVRVFFKGTSTIKSLLMHPKDPIPDTHKTDIIYHWKWPANNCTAEYIGETNRSLKERVSDHRNQTTSAIRYHHISTKHPQAELKRFYNNRQTEQHPTLSSKRSTSHSYQRSITQQKHWQSQNSYSIQQTSQTCWTTRTSTKFYPLIQGGTFFTWSFNTKDN